MKIPYISKQCGKVLHIYDPVYQQNYYYFNCRTHKEYVKLLKSKFNIDREPNEDIGGNCSIHEHRGIFIVFIWTIRRGPDIIAHEVLHAVSWILRNRDIPLKDDTEEAYAYLTQFLMKEILAKR